jgi:hypothetical protein
MSHINQGVRQQLMPDRPAPLADTLTIGADIVVNRLGFGATRLTGPTMPARNLIARGS